MKHINTLLLIAAGSFSGCVTNNSSNMGSLEIQALQTKEFECVKSVGLAATISVFQDYGYIIESADSATGFITAASPTSGGFRPFVGQVMENSKATAFIEEIKPNITTIRLNFVHSKESSSGYGMKSKNDKPVLDPTYYNDVFTKIGDSIFIRAASK